MDHDITFTGEINATDGLVPLMQEYVRYSTREFLPDNIDGLTLLYRRVLNAVEKVSGNIKCTTLVGDVMKVHPHGDSGIEGGIKQLGQPFSQAHPWLTIKGNFGSFGGGAPAAGRYLDIQANGFAKDIFFEDIDMRTLTYIPSEMGEGVEPSYLIPKIPTALLTGITAMCGGYATNVPMLNFNSVCTLVEKFIALRKKYPFNYRTKANELAKYCIPDFPWHSMLRNRKQLSDEYSKGNYKVPIVMDGIMDIGPSDIHLRSIPFGKVMFDQVITKVGSMMNTANTVSANCTEICDLSTGVDYGNMLVKLKRTTNPFDFLDELKRLTSFTQKNHPNWTFVDKEGCVTTMTPMELMDLWYHARYRSVLAGLKFVNNDLFKQMRKLAALIIIADHTDEVLQIFKTSENRQSTIPLLTRQFGLTAEQAEYIASLQLHQITRQGKDDLLREYAAIKEKIKEFQKKFQHVDDIILEQVAKLKDKYGSKCERRTILPRFIGAVRFPEYNGCIQFDSMEELGVILKKWSRTTACDILMYPSGSRTEMYCSDGNFVFNTELDLPKEFKASYLHVSKTMPKYTILLKNGEISKTIGMTYFKEKSGICAYAGERFTAVTSKFKLIQCDTSTIVKRNTADAKGSRTDILYLNGLNEEDVVIAVANNRIPNTVVLSRLHTGERYCANLLGKNKILGMWKYGEPISFIVPDEFMNHCTVNSVILFETKDLFKSDSKLTVYLNRRKTSDDKPLHLITKNVDILSDKTIEVK